MARRSSRLSTENGASNTKHKRVASGTEIAGTLVKRAKSQATETVKSQYFAGSQDDENNDDPDVSSPSVDHSGSDFEDETGDNATPSEANESEDEEYESEDDSRSRKTGKYGKAGRPSIGSVKASDVWKPGVKTGLGPGKQVIIKKPKARPAGKTPYVDETIHPNTLLFLGDLRANNQREWLKLNDPDFRASEKDFFGFVEKMSEKLTEIDDTIPELPYKDVVFRIYRDVRFSKDPTPYKDHFSVAWSRSGRKGPFAHYYLQIAPKKSFVGGGIWHPDAEPLNALRRDVDRNPQRIRAALSDERLSKAFFDISKANSKQVVKAFTKYNAESALKTRPKDYAADHPDIEILRLKNYTIGRKLSDDEVLGEAGASRIAELLSCMKPWITYLNSVVMPDDPESEEEGEDEEDVSGGAEDGASEDGEDDDD